LDSNLMVVSELNVIQHLLYAYLRQQPCYGNLSYPAGSCLT